MGGESMDEETKIHSAHQNKKKHTQTTQTMYVQRNIEAC
jgi:hypothetical protein